MLSAAYAECHLCGESHISPFMLSVTMQNVIMLSVVMLNVIILSVVIRLTDETH
jgi:hypothetical protein